ncbi:hypothetical protein ACPV5A_03725 [Vibrio chagasii]|uniref:hypothetical protein n=1 Tax=Vibrio chagasii TaxID=170679 RepID=UPI0040697785
MQRILLLVMMTLSPSSNSSESISDVYLLVQVEEYKINDANQAVEYGNIIASWIVQKTDSIQYPFMCTTLLNGYLDSEKTKRQNVLRLRKMLSESEGVAKLFTDSDNTARTLDSSRKKTEQKIKNIDQFSYRVECLEIIPNSELKKYFSFDGE